MNKEKDIAIFKLGGTGFHKDLHRMCEVIPPKNRHFDGERWHIKYASQYAEQLHVWWPEFATWVKEFQNQMEFDPDFFLHGYDDPDWLEPREGDHDR